MGGLENAPATALIDSSPLAANPNLYAAAVQASGSANPTLHAAGSTSTNAQGEVVGASAANSTKKYVVFRDEDMGFGNVSALEAVDQVHIEENVPVTLGIIPHPNLCGVGNELLWNVPINNYLRSIADNPLFEFAQHGYDHYDYAQLGAPSCSASAAGVGVPQAVGGAAPYYEVGESPVPGQLVPGQPTGAPAGLYSEFWGRPYADQYASIKQGRDDIEQAFGVTPTTFIPPWNKGDNNTLKAAHALGFTLYSTAVSDFNVREASLQGIMVQGESTGILGWNNDTAWQTGMQSLTRSTDAALNNMTAGQDFVVGYHFWAFEKPDGSVDPVRVALFKQYIDHLKSRGDVAFTTLAGQNLRQSTQLSLSVNNARGQTIAFSGTLQTGSTSPVRIANSSVYLQVSTNDKNWSLASSTAVATDTSGAYVFLKSFPVGTYYFRTYYPGSDTYREAFSQVVTMRGTTLPTTLTIHVTNSGSAYTFYGALSVIKNMSRIPDATVMLQVSADNKHWSNAWAPTTTNAAGDYTLFTTLTQARTDYFRAYYAGSIHNHKAFSQVIKVAVK